MHVQGLDARPGRWVGYEDALGGWGAGLGYVGDAGVQGEARGVVEEVEDGRACALFGW